MRRSRSEGELIFDPKIEHTLRQLRRERREYEEYQARNMAEENNPNRRAMKDYMAPSLNGCTSSIVRPPVQTNNFELKTSLIQFIQNNYQFSRLPSEDPNEHISTFLEICDMVKMNGATNDVIQLRLFQFSLKDKARA